MDSRPANTRAGRRRTGWHPTGDVPRSLPRRHDPLAAQLLNARLPIPPRAACSRTWATRRLLLPLRPGSEWLRRRVPAQGCTGAVGRGDFVRGEVVWLAPLGAPRQGDVGLATERRHGDGSRVRRVGSQPDPAKSGQWNETARSNPRLQLELTWLTLIHERLLLLAKAVTGRASPDTPRPEPARFSRRSRACLNWPESRYEPAKSTPQPSSSPAKRYAGPR